MTVNIKGKEYVTVAERVTAMLEDHKGQLVAMATEIVEDTAETVTVKATLTLTHGTFTGHAQSHKSANTIEGQAPLEVAETSAVGRALGFAGYGMVDSIASAEEVTVAQTRKPAMPVNIRPLPVNMQTCAQCGEERVFKQGVSKKGSPYRGWFCPTKDCSPPVWVKDEPENLPPDDMEVPFE